MRHLLKITCSFLLLFFFIACNSTKENDSQIAKTEIQAPEISIKPSLVKIKTADFIFLEVPDTIPSGMTTFRVENEGAFPHNAAIGRLTGDHTYDELITYVMDNESQFPEWFVFMGGPSAPLSGETSEATMQLFPGNYAIICGVPVPAGMPHFMKGMTKPLTVVKREGDQAPAPEENLIIVMDDYSFKMEPSITAGTKTIRVENNADQDHEFLLVRLKEGKSGGDIINWLGTVIQSDDPLLPEAPGEFLNGVSTMEKGLVNYINVNFSPGEYVLICPILDEEDGRPHFMHGMVHQFTVEEE